MSRCQQHLFTALGAIYFEKRLMSWHLESSENSSEAIQQSDLWQAISHLNNIHLKTLNALFRITFNITWYHIYNSNSNSVLPLNIRHVCDRLKKKKTKKTKKKQKTNQITNKRDTLQWQYQSLPRVVGPYTLSNR